MSPSINHRTRGYFLGILAAAAYGTNPLFALPLYEEGMSVDSVLFYRYIIAAIMMAMLMLARKENFKLERRQIPAIAIAGILLLNSDVTRVPLKYPPIKSAPGIENRMQKITANSVVISVPVIMAIVSQKCYMLIQ